MLEFSNLIKVESTSDDKPKSYQFIADSFSYIPQLTSDDGSSYWNCDRTIVIDRPDESARKFFSIERNAIVTIRRSDRTEIRIGTRDIPARVQISSNLTSSNLIIKCKMLRDPLS